MVSSVAKKNPSTKGKSSSSRAKKAKKPLKPPLLKVVVRRLPHQMKEEEFLTALEAAATDAGMGVRGGSWDLIYFTPGKMSKKRGTVTGTGYLHIDRARGGTADLTLMKLRAAVLASDALTAAAKDSKPSEKSAAGPMVEAAPFQKLFKKNPKRDARVGTIERDADYKAFCASLKSPAPPLPSADIQADIRESEGKEEPKPQNALLDFLKERGAKKTRDSLRAVAVGTAHSSRGGSRRVSSVSGTPSGSSSGSTATSAGVSGGTSSATRTSRTGSLTPTKIATSRAAPASDLTEKPKKDGEKETSSRSGGSSREPRGGSTTTSRQPPPPPPPPSPPPPDSMKPSRSGSGSATTAPASASRTSAAETKGRAVTKSGGGRTTQRSGKTASASSAPATGATSAARPAAILAKSSEPKAKSDPVAAVIANASSSTSSPRSGGGGSGGGVRRGAGSGRRGRTGGRSSSSSKTDGGGSGRADA